MLSGNGAAGRMLSTSRNTSQSGQPLSIAFAIRAALASSVLRYEVKMVFMPSLPFDRNAAGPYPIRVVAIEPLGYKKALPHGVAHQVVATLDCGITAKG